MNRCRIAVAGVDRSTSLLIEQLLRNDRFQWVALSDLRLDALRDYESHPASPALYNDAREMLNRTAADVLLIWHDADLPFLIDVAVDRELWTVIRPAGHVSAEHTVNLLRKAQKRNVGLFAWAPWQMVPSFESAIDWLMGQTVTAASVRFDTSAESLDAPPSTRTLISLTYPSLSLIQGWMGLPTSVYCRELHLPPTSLNSPERYHGAIHLHYPQGLATLTVSMNAGPDRYELAIQGTSGTIETAPPLSQWYDRSGKLLACGENYTSDQARSIGYERFLGAIWQAWQARQRSTSFDWRRHLPVRLTLEIAALSSRTGEPEKLTKLPETAELPMLE